jgi:hypothetical protein
MELSELIKILSENDFAVREFGLFREIPIPNQKSVSYSANTVKGASEALRR